MHSRRGLAAALALALMALVARPDGPAQAQPVSGEPASQPAAPTPSPAPRPPASPSAAVPLGEPTPEELAELAELEGIINRYRGASGENQARMREILTREYDRRLRELQGRYQEDIANSEKNFRAKHLSAIRLLKDFLAKYPNDPHWTPDAMFRLADLYLDQAKWDFDAAQEALANSPLPPVEEEVTSDAAEAYVGPDYAKALELWNDLVRRFPEYRQADSVVYLLAYYYGEMRRIVESKQAYLGLVCRNKFDPLEVPKPEPEPDRRARLLVAASSAAPAAIADPYESCAPLKEEGQDLIDEAWVRIGEAHFDSRGELDQAIAAYKRVVGRTSSKFFDIALYKLAWSYYRNNQFMEGVRAFDQLVAFSDRLEDSGGQKSELRPEAMRYIAISFADPWETDPGALADPVKSLERANQFYKDRTAERHVRDVYEELGDALRIQAGTPSAGGPVPPEITVAYNQAIRAWRFTLDQWPLHPRSPNVQKKIIDALAFMGDAAAAIEERRRFAETFSKDTPWYKANETNREAIEYAQRQGELAMLDAARDLHRRAYLARRDWKTTPTAEGKTAYLGLYLDASRLYYQYLAQYPTASEVYAVTYDLAECLFYGEQFVESVPYYRWIRDHKELGGKHQAAADSIVKAHEAAVDKAKREGTLVEPPVPTVEALAQGAAPIPVPELYRGLQAAYDEYNKLSPDQTAPVKALASAMISFRHVQLDEALARFNDVMVGFCQLKEAEDAKDGMLVVHQSRGDNAKFGETNQRFLDLGCGNTAARELATAQNLSNDYIIASKLFKEQKFEDAGQAFYSVFRSSPDSYANRAASLFNAALAYGKAGKPKTAIAIYQEFLKVPAFRNTDYYVEVLFSIAINYQNAFDYETAAQMFLEVAEAARQKGVTARPDFNLEQARLDAMWNAARMRDLDRVYYDRGRNDLGAAELYKRYAREEAKDRKRASTAYYAAALVYEKANNVREMIRTFGEWKRLYGADPESALWTVQSQYKIAKAMEKQRDRKAAEEYYRSTIKTFDASGEKPGTPAAELAAEAQFWLAEKEYRASFEPYKVKWLGNINSENQKKAEKAVQDTLAALAQIVTKNATNYTVVARFEASWSLAVYVRLGDLMFFGGQKLLETPPPKEIVQLDQQDPSLGALDTYMSMLEELVRPQTEDAEQKWLKAVEAAKAQGVANEWSKLAQARLNAFVAADRYPVQRDEIIDREVNP